MGVRTKRAGCPISPTEIFELQVNQRLILAAVLNLLKRDVSPEEVEEIADLHKRLTEQVDEVLDFEGMMVEEKRDMRGALERYEEEVNASDLKQTTRDTRIREAAYFVRWLNNDYWPGMGLKR